jgi:hypothetical protein
MVPAKRRNVQPTLKEVQELFDRWRKGKRGRDPIPQPLWKAAISLSTRHSINTISKHLHLSYNDLKAHAVHAGSAPAGPNPPAFIELAALTGVECTIEMEKPSGERMRIRGSCNVVELARAFFR